MLQSEKTHEALSYFNAQIQKTETAVLAGIFEHLAANVHLSRWAERAGANGIKTEIDARICVSVLEGISIDNIDLTDVLRNILENALEGCLRLPKEAEKEIIVTAKFINNRLRLQI